jgi:hypothetical protein
MSLTKLSLAENSLIFLWPERVWLVTSWLGTGKSLNFFYNVENNGKLFVPQLIIICLCEKVIVCVHNVCS